jgi:multidrug efflux pump subunit AcrB
MAGHHTRNLIRTLTAAALCSALVACTVTPVPADLPAVAIRQASLYRLEVALLVFYGALLLITPAFSGLLRGRLPIEISTRGAKFAEEADQSAEVNEAAIKKLQLAADSLTESLEQAIAEIDELKRKAGDST